MATTNPQSDPPSGNIWRSYYYAGGQRLAVRVQGEPEAAKNGLFFLLGDHLGSTSVSYNAGTHAYVTERYMPWRAARRRQQPADQLYLHRPIQLHRQLRAHFLRRSLV